MYVSRWWWAFWTIFEGKHDQKCGKSLMALLKDWRQTIHDVCNTVRLLHGKCQSNLSDELNTRHIAAKFAPRLMSKDQNEYCIAVWTKIKEQPEKTQTSTPTSLLVMNLGYLGTTQRRRSSHLSGKLQLHCDRRKFGAMSNQCWFFLTLTETCMRNLFHH